MPASRRRRRSKSPQVAARIEVGLSLAPAVIGQVQSLLGGHPRASVLLEHAGVGVVRAAKTYDRTRGVPFKAWVGVNVRSAVLDGLRRSGPLPRTLYRRLRAIEAARWAVEEASIMGEVQMADVEFAEAALDAHLASMASALATRSLHSTDGDVLDAIPDERGTPEDELELAETKERVRAALAERPPRERQFLERYYYEGATMEEASGGLSRSWASRIHARALKALAKTLKAHSSAELRRGPSAGHSRAGMSSN